MEVIYAIHSIKIVLSIIGLLLHGMGIYSLKKRNKWNNQVIILMNLSTAEIILLTNVIIADSMGFMKQSEEYYANGIIDTLVGSKVLPEIYKQVYCIIFYFGCLEMKSLLILLTIERLICILSPLHYHIVVQEKSIFQKMVITSWCISVVLSLLSLLPKIMLKTVKTSIIFNIAIIILFSVSYTLIGLKIKKSRRSLQITANTPHTDETVSIKKHHLVPVTIIITFIIFYIIPSQILVLCVTNQQSTMATHILLESIELFPIAGFISDALIYIFLTKGNRDIIFKLLGC